MKMSMGIFHSNGIKSTKENVAKYVQGVLRVSSWITEVSFTLINTTVILQNVYVFIKKINKTWWKHKPWSDYILLLIQNVSRMNNVANGSKTIAFSFQSVHIIYLHPTIFVCYINQMLHIFQFLPATKQTQTSIRMEQTQTIWGF